MPVKDAVIPFVFESMPVRGALVQLDRTWLRMQRDNDYADVAATVLGHTAAATALIAQALKFDGKITLQINSGGPLSMLVVQCTDDLDMRGMMSVSEVSAEATFAQLVTDARCAVTVDAGAMERPYQGIVQVSPESIAASLENYFAQSVQIPSQLMLCSDRTLSGGILLQQIRGETPVAEDDWRRLGLLARTLRTVDLVEGIGTELLRKLFSEDDIRRYSTREVHFRCGCSQAKVEDVLRLLGEAETRAACEAEGKVDVTCEYCGRLRSFDAVDVARVFAEQALSGTLSVH